MLMHFSPIYTCPHLDGLPNEAWVRFDQLQYLLERVVDHERQTTELHIIHTGLRQRYPDDKRLLDYARKFTQDHYKNSKRTIIYLESFYIFAFRIVQITRAVNGALSLKKGCREPSGVMDARNKLILHPEQVKDGPILSRTAFFSLAEGVGVKLKNQRDPHESVASHDPGFRPNALELRNFWIKWWQRVYTELHNQHDSSKTLPPD